MGKRGFITIFKSSAFKITLMVGLFLTSALIVVAMYLGQESGLFVIRVQNGDLEKSIALCEDEVVTEESQMPKKTTAPGKSNMTDTSPELFIQEDYKSIKEYYAGIREASESDENGNSLYLYRFHVVNTGTGGVGVSISMSGNNVTHHLDEIIRVMTYYEVAGNQYVNVYQKADTVEYDYEHYDAPGLQLHTFKDAYTIFDDQWVNIDSQDGSNSFKFMVLIWLEGQDPDSDKYGEELYNGTMNFQIDFKVSMEH